MGCGRHWSTRHERGPIPFGVIYMPYAHVRDAKTMRRSTVMSARGRAEVELAPEEVEAWLHVLNDARLALGARLGITEDPEAEEIDPSDPEAAAHAMYAWLTWLENDLVETLLG